MLQSRAKVDYAAEKAMYLSLPLEEKRKFYKCKDNYRTLSKVPTWREYYMRNQLEAPKGNHVDYVLRGEKVNVENELNEKISLWEGDITTLEIDAIVNAANSSLMGGGGVDGAIHRAAGDEFLLPECKSLGNCPTGEAKISGGYKLPAKYIIHTVGPQVYGSRPEKQERNKLESCYRNSLSCLMEHNLRTVAFPCISTGIYGYPHGDACVTAAKVVRTFLEKNRENVDRVIFCVFLPEDKRYYEIVLQILFPVDSSELEGAKDVAADSHEASRDPPSDKHEDRMTSASPGVSKKELHEEHVVQGRSELPEDEQKVQGSTKRADDEQESSKPADDKHAEKTVKVTLV